MHKNQRGGVPVDRGGATVDSGGAPVDRGGAPIDRGWAWMVVLGTFLIYLIHPSYFYFTSVLFLDFMDVFDTSATMVTLILAMTNVSYCISTLVLVNFVMPITSVRKLTTISCLVYSVANWAVVVAPNLPVFFVVCVIKYTAQGGVLVPPLTLVGHYFERRRALATSLSLLGISVASITVPPLTRYIRNEYGFRGCFLLLSAYEMQAIIAAMLLRPLSCYSQKPEPTKAQQGTVREQVEVETDEDEQRTMFLETTSRNSQHSNKPGEFFEPGESAEEGNIYNLEFQITVSEKFEACVLFKEYATSDVTNLSDEGEKNNDVACITNGHSPDIEKPFDEENSYRRTDNSQTYKYKPRPLAVADKKINETTILNSNSGVENIVEDFSELKLIEINRSSTCRSRVDHEEFHLCQRKDSWNQAELLEMTDRYELKTGQTKTSSVTFCDVDAPLHQERTFNLDGETHFRSKLSVDDRAELDSLIKSKEDAKIVCDKHATKKSFFAKGLKVTSSALDFSLLRNYLAILYLLTFGLHHSSVFLATYVPSYAVKVGVSQANAATLLTIVGTCDGVSRVAYGFFADLHLVRPGRVLAGLYMFLGLVCQFASRFTTLEGLVFLAVSYGCCGLSHLSLNAPLIVDLLGVEHLGKVFAIGALTSSVFISVQFPVHGVLIEATDSFVASFHWIGATFMLSALCLLSEPVVRRLEHKRTK